MAAALLIAFVAFLAWSNGANDNFKGVATLYGSGSASYRKALTWATVTTLAGSLLAVVLAAGLVKAFSAKGLVPDAVAGSSSFLTAAAAGAALTVMLASLLGLPVSTTHALTGALVGAALARGAPITWSVLGKGFFLPLLLSPVVAVALTMTLYPLARRLRQASGIERESCVCIAGQLVPVVQPEGSALAERVQLAVTTGVRCEERYTGTIVGLRAGPVLDGLHFASAGAVCFARALNDTPKIVGILIGGKALGAHLGLPLVALAMAVGGVLGARRVAETLAKKIVPLDTEQGFVANATTSLLVIAASRYGLPVSTTHVSTGGLFGIGAITGKARWSTVLVILVAWATTLPLGAALGAAASFALVRAG